jgi:hypothetical protein
MQYIIALACWAVVVEREQTTEKGLHMLMEKLYLGDQNDDDIVSMQQQFYDGEGRFQHIYEDLKNERIAICFGSMIAGIHKKHFKDLLDVKTFVKKTSKLIGKDIKNKADKALREGKKYLAFWNEFLDKDGKFESGKNEDDALNHVLIRVKETLNSDQEEDEEEEEDDEISTSDFTTACMACFIFYGPYSKKWGLEVYELFSVDTTAIDEKAKKRKLEKRKAALIDEDDTKNIRGDRRYFYYLYVNI